VPCYRDSGPTHRGDLLRNRKATYGDRICITGILVVELIEAHRRGYGWRNVVSHVRSAAQRKNGLEVGNIGGNLLDLGLLKTLCAGNKRTAHLVLDNYAHTRQRWSASGYKKDHSITCPSLPRMPPGSTRWNAGSHCLHNGRSSAVHTPARRNSKRSANSSRPTTNSPNPFDGPSSQTRPWPPSLDSLLLPSPHTHPQLIREINDSGDYSTKR
jgi:hypothetical protein